MISHKHKFLFSHINKCGGTAVDTVLVKYCDKFLEEHTDIPVDKLYKSLNQTKHQDMRQMINNETKDYFKFAFVRNPWDKLVSVFYYRRRRYGQYTSLNFRHFIKYKIKTLKVDRMLNRDSDALQYNWLCDLSGKLVTDFVGKLENFQQDFDVVCDKIAIPQQKLPHLNKTKHKHYTEYYDEETKQIVAEKYAKDIEYFGYKFGE